jgi:FkbM family methyltransferase
VEAAGFRGIIHRLEATFGMDGASRLTRDQRAGVTSLLEAALDDVIDIVAPGMFLEVGAFDAAFSRRMKARYPDATCIALEANPRVFERFRAEVQVTGVDYVHVAAAAGSGKVGFFIPEVIAGHAQPHVSRMGSLNQISAKNSAMTEVTVPALAIDELLGNATDNRLCMWMDVEGAIDKVLDGAVRILQRTALIYCEIEERQIWEDQPLASDVIARLEAAGFILAARDFQTPVQFNALLIRADQLGADRILARLAAFAEVADEKVRAMVAGG